MAAENKNNAFSVIEMRPVIDVDQDQDPKSGKFCLHYVNNLTSFIIDLAKSQHSNNSNPQKDTNSLTSSLDKRSPEITNPPQGKAPMIEPQNMHEEEKMTLKRSLSKFQDKMKNSNGRVATRHTNKKYYCGDRMKFKHKSEHYPKE